MSGKFNKEKFIDNWFGFSYNKRKKYKSDSTLVRAVYKRNEKRIEEAFGEYTKNNNLTLYDAFKQLVKEHSVRTYTENGATHEKKIRTTREALGVLSRTNYFVDQEMRGKVAWHASFKGNAPDVYRQFLNELQRNWHEKYDLTKWQWEEAQSTWDRQVYSYEKVKQYHGKDGKIYKTERYKIYVAQTNSPDTFQVLTPDILGKEAPIDYLRKKHAKRSS